MEGIILFVDGMKCTVLTTGRRKKHAKECVVQSAELKENHWKNICFICKRNLWYIYMYRVLNYVFHSRLKYQSGWEIWYKELMAYSVRGFL